MNPQFQVFRKQITQALKFRLFLLQKLPSAFFAGLKIESFDEKHAAVTVKHKWFNQNPFRSLYFAIQSMAAEMSTGLLCYGQLYQRKPAVSMLVLQVKGSFSKKATGKITFTCNDGAAIEEAVEEAVKSGNGTIVKCLSVGKDEISEIVSEFEVVWSFKTKKIRS
jgi:hypothetical protein